MSEMTEINLERDLDANIPPHLRDAWQTLLGFMSGKHIEGLGAFNSMLQINRTLRGYVFSGK